jgi:hypothetical protein
MPTTDAVVGLVSRLRDFGAAWLTEADAAHVAELLEAARGLAEATDFYADPDTYFAIGIFPDPPCGEFMEDFSKAERESDGYVRDYPGKRAREALATWTAAVARVEAR